MNHSSRIQPSTDHGFFRRCASFRGASVFAVACCVVERSPARGDAGADPILRPSVVVFFIDDLNCRLGCYGDPVARTPQIDELARRSVRFERAYSQNPLCLPSRTALITGLRPETTGVFNNEAGTIRDNYPGAVTLPQYFRRHGYDVASVGKTFYSHGFDDPEAQADIAILPSEPGRRIVGYGMANLAVEARVRQILAEKLPPARMTYWGPLACDDAETREGQIARAAARFLKTQPRRPFFLAVGFQRPHLPFVAPAKHFDAYSLEAMSLPPVAEEDRKDAPSVDIGVDYAVSTLERLPATGPLRVGESVRRRMMQSYYAAISFTDAQIGFVLQALREARWVDDTIVVLVSDNGFLLGEHGRWAKSWLYEESVRVPLMIAAPGKAKTGAVARGLVEFVDLYPTLAELCGLPPTVGIDGQSFAALLANPGAAGKRAVSAVTFVGERMVRTEQWKLILNPPGLSRRGLLFDLSSDPGEHQNLFESPSHQSVVAELVEAMPARLRQLEGLPTLSARKAGRAAGKRPPPK